MNHEVKIVNKEERSLTKALGISDEAFVGMVDNLTLEIFHAHLFEGDNRGLADCLVDALDNLESSEFGIEPQTSNDYVVLGLALAKSHDLVETMIDGVRKKAAEREPTMSEMASIMERIAGKAKQTSSPIETKGSLN